jgi:hypothetical protein
MPAGAFLLAVKCRSDGGSLAFVPAVKSMSDVSRSEGGLLAFVPAVKSRSETPPEELEELEAGDVLNNSDSSRGAGLLNMLP